MKYLYYLLITFMISNCSLNNDSKFWNENNIQSVENKNQLSKILAKKENILSMTENEYKIYVDDYIKKSKYPNISQ